MNDDWNDDGWFDPDEEWYEEFPCDLFLSDLDGEWHDDSVYAGHGPMGAGTDGIYDSHTGSRNPEIWVSRIDASRISYGSALNMYQDYFDRVHDYRTGEFKLPSKGLFYVDQDWRDYYDNEKMNLVCDNYEEIRDTMITDASDYKNQLAEGGLFLTVCVHSSPEAHYFHKANWEYSDEFLNWELSFANPGYGFYNLFACSNCRWVEPNCMGSIYSLFGNGLASVGSAKTGSMLFFSRFNIPLSNGLGWGEAFRLWSNFWINDHGNSTSLRSWFMGMCLLGDATLDLSVQGGIAESEREENEPLTLEIESMSFNQAQIYFVLPEAGHVRLEVFDASGRLTATLLEGMLGKGQHSLSWDCGNAAAGVYFVRVEGDAGSAVGKVVVIR